MNFFLAFCLFLALACGACSPTGVGIESNPSQIAQVNPAKNPNLKTCTAKEVDVVVGEPVILGGDTCSDGYINLKFSLAITSNTNRYNFGLFVSNDGKCAGGNNCADRSTNYSGVVSFACDGQDQPFVQLAPTDDTCGDMTSANPVVWWITGTFNCDFLSNLGKLTIPNCIIWDQNEPKVANACTSLEDAGTGSKCQCEPFTFPVCQFLAPDACGISTPCATKGCDNARNGCYVDYHPSTTVCRASAGVCDVAETCTGSSDECPADGFEPSSTVCRASAGVCDVAETCTGTSASCPADGFESSSTVCRASADVCDVAETCTGTSASCPADGFEPSSTVCRASAGVCDVVETCTGTSAACPADGFEPSSTVCRPSTGDCSNNIVNDPQENCPGNGPDCPPDITFPCQTCCTLTHGYWKTHSESWANRKLRDAVPSPTWQVVEPSMEQSQFYGCENITWFWVLSESPDTDMYKTLIQAGRQYIAAYLSIAQCGDPVDGSTLPDATAVTIGEVNYSVRACYQAVHTAVETCALPLALDGYDIHVCAGILDSFVNGGQGWAHCGDSSDPSDPGYCYRHCGETAM